MNVNPIPDFNLLMKSGVIFKIVSISQNFSCILPETFYIILWEINETVVDFLESTNAIFKL